MRILFVLLVLVLVGCGDNDRYQMTDDGNTIIDKSTGDVWKFEYNSKNYEYRKVPRSNDTLIKIDGVPFEDVFR